MVDKISDSVETIGKINEGFNKSMVIGGIIVIIILLWVIFSLNDLPYINGLFGFIFNGSKVLRYVGFGGAGICLVGIFLKKFSSLLKKLLLVFGVCIAVSYLLPNMINIEGNLSLTNYTKVKYIEFENIKIPTLYSVVGKREIVMSFEEEDYYDEGMERKYDLVSIVYKNLSDQDRSAYENKLLENDYTKVTFYNGEENITVLAKNHSNNTFVTISIEDLAITYSNIEGTYETVLLGGN